MRKLLVTILVAFLSLSCVLGIDLNEADSLYDAGEFDLLYDELLVAAEGTPLNFLKAQLYWRLSRCCAAIGTVEKQENPSEAENWFQLGLDYSEQSIKCMPTKDGYLWHMISLGSYAITQPASYAYLIMDDIASDFTYLLDKLEALDSAEVWHALMEYYHMNPTKSDIQAISFGRMACGCATEEEVKVINCVYMAQLLYARNWNASRRSREFKNMEIKFKRDYASNIEKYCYYEGTLADYVPEWSTKKLSQLSDAEEAVQMLEYSKKICESGSELIRDMNINQINDLLTQWR